MLGMVDAVVADPPYGIGADVAQNAQAANRKKAAGKSKSGRGWKEYKQTEWDSKRPSDEIFYQCIKMSKEQIIWGGNYFADILPPSMRWLVWDKGQRNFTLADCEVAWTSQNKAMRVFDYSRGKALGDGRSHPTQKPVALMQWCLGFLPNAETILDPFMGSGTTLVACAKLGRKGIGIEMDPDYFEIACKRVQAAYDQPDLFVAPPAPATQEGFDL
jgi:DNA modification methylase